MFEPWPPIDAANPLGVDPPSLRAVAVTWPGTREYAQNFEPSLVVPQVTRPSGGSETQTPSFPAQFCVAVAATASSNVTGGFVPARITSMA